MARSRTRRRPGHWESLKEFVGLWTDLFARHNLLNYATAIAFRAFIATVALALLALGVLGEVGRTDVWTNQIAPVIAPKVLPTVYGGIDETVQKIFDSSSIPLILFAGVLTIWEVSSVVRACMGALSRVYEDEDDRPWWIRFPLSIAIAIVLTASLVGALLLITAARGAVGGAWEVPFTVLRWLLAVVAIAVGFGVLVRYAPCEPRTKRWVSGGTALVVVAWVVQSLIFAEYLRLANWKSASGSLLGIYFLTTFLYVAAIVLLVGIELDEQLRRDLQGSTRERGILELVRDVL
ncbi:MAG TPA: YihY/virulence factor BrkB family protein [Gaiellaceae bacterium]|nr:YihY/virulence factor BrkB family protein [Gaiellaceae bacterium]